MVSCKNVFEMNRWQLCTTSSLIILVGLVTTIVVQELSDSPYMSLQVSVCVAVVFCILNWGSGEKSLERWGGTWGCNYMNRAYNDIIMNKHFPKFSELILTDIDSFWHCKTCIEFTKVCKEIRFHLKRFVRWNLSCTNFKAPL